MSFSIRKLAVVTAGSGLAVAPFSALSTSAFADDYDCGDSIPAATTLGDGVCFVTYLEDGEYTFTAPTELDAVSAVIVGAGGGSAYPGDETPGVFAYGGGGGEVVVVDTVDVSSPLSIVVGNGGYYDTEDPSNSADGEDTTLDDGASVAHGGKTATPSGGGASGNGNTGRWNPIELNAEEIYFVGGGGGSGSAAPEEDDSPTYPGTAGQGGEGTRVSSEPLFAWLWQPEINDQILGEGGTVSTGDFTELYRTIPGHGGNVFRFAVTDEGVNDNISADIGSDGAVFLAWYADESGGDGSYGDDALPETGTNIQPWTIAGGLVALLAGAVALTRRRERL